MKIGDIIRVEYFGRLRYVKIMEKAPRRSARTSILWWRCHVEPQDYGSLTGYQRILYRSDEALEREAEKVRGPIIERVAV